MPPDARNVHGPGVFASACFVTLVTVTGAAALATTTLLADLRSPLLTGVAFVVLLHAYAIALHRLLLQVLPLHEGPVVAGTRAAFGYQLHLLFYLMLFNSLIRSRVLPIPLMRLIYLALGARLGAGTYCAGTIFDPVFVTVGHDTLIGEAALLVPHVLEGGAPAHFPIAIGNHVTIGTHAVVLSGVTIADHAIVAAHALVTKGTAIGAGEVWGGVPARRLRGATAELPPLDQSA